MNATDIIEAFGGASAVALRFGASRTAVCNWRRTGIPARFWIPMLAAAKAAKLTGITEGAVMWRPAKAAATCEASP